MTRNFDINGKISVVESVYFQEKEKAAEVGLAIAQKETVCATTNVQLPQAGKLECVNITVCPPNIGFNGDNGDIEE